MEIRPFSALRPQPEIVAQVASLPYDVVSTEEARQLTTDNPLSMLNVVRPEVHFPPEIDPYSDVVYAKAVEYFQKWQEDGTLLREDSPCLYLYEQEMEGRCQRGIVAKCLTKDYEAGLIKKHEKTRPDKENDRTRLTSELNAHPGPVFLTYRDQLRIDALVDAVVSINKPLYNVTAEDGIRHTVWKIQDTAALVDAFGEVPYLYVADGHHRAASAARVGRERREANPHHTGEEDYNSFLCVLFPASQLHILGYHRLVKDLNGLSAGEFIEEARKVGNIEAVARPELEGPGQVSFYLEGQWYRLTWEGSALSSDDPVDVLDVSVLQNQLLAPILGIEDPRTNNRIEFVGGMRGSGFLEAAVDSKKSAVAFFLYPVQIGQLLDVADAGLIMPPKSTWFEPKLRSGFLIHTF